jgi:hypothetical protein
VTTLTTGPISYPLQRPVCAFWDGGRIAKNAPSPVAAATTASVLDSSNDSDGGDEERSRGASTATPKHRGRLVVVGSTQIFSDDYIGKEQNSTLLRIILQWLMAENAMEIAKVGNAGDIGSNAASKNDDILSKRTLPDTEA